MNSLDAVRNTT